MWDLSKQETANAFYEGLKNKGISHEYLRVQGGSHEWIQALADKVERCSTKVLDGMKADLVFHFNLLEEKHAKGIKFGEKWSRPMAPNIQEEIIQCKTCTEQLGMTKGISIEHILDMHSDICLFCGGGTDQGFTPQTVTFIKKSYGDVTKGVRRE